SQQQPVPASPSVSVSASSLNFGNQKVTVSSAPQSLTVSNAGNSTLTLAGVTVSGDFAQTNNCGSSLAPGATCTVSVTFTPRTPGTHTGSIAIAHNAASSPQAITLTGAGVVPTIAASIPKSFSDQIVDTTSAPQTITVTNTSIVSAVIAGIT